MNIPFSLSSVYLNFICFSSFFFSGMIDPSNQHLEWHSPPQNVLIVKKHMDPEVTRQFKDMVQWLITVSASKLFLGLRLSVMSEIRLVSNW
jgi:hypothetical protein